MPQDLDMEEEAEQRRTELGISPEEPEPRPATAFMPARAGRLVQSSLPG